MDLLKLQYFLCVASSASMEEAAGEPAAAVVATGEGLEQVLKYCRHTIELDQNLLMEGLYRLYQKNTAGSRKDG